MHFFLLFTVPLLSFLLFLLLWQFCPLKRTVAVLFTEQAFSKALPVFSTELNTFPNVKEEKRAVFISLDPCAELRIL